MRQMDDLEPLARPDVREPSSAGGPNGAERRAVRTRPSPVRSVQHRRDQRQQLSRASTSWRSVPPATILATWRSAPPARGHRRRRSIPVRRIHKVAHLNDGLFGDESELGLPGPWQGLGRDRAARAPRGRPGRLGPRPRGHKSPTGSPTDYTIEVATERGQWRVVASSADRQAYVSVRDAQPKGRGRCRRSRRR